MRKQTYQCVLGRVPKKRSPNEDIVGLLVHPGFGEVFESGVGVAFPELLQSVDLVGVDLASPLLLIDGRHADYPVQEAAVTDQGLPLLWIPEK